MFRTRLKLFCQIILKRKTNINYKCHINDLIRKYSTNNFVPTLHSSKISKMKCRENPIVTKLDTPQFKSLFTPELEKLVELFQKYNHEIRIAGGAVRDLLMGITPSDIDFATTATPTEMKEMYEAENIRMINMNGEKHGTITARIDDKQNFEVTTLRIDVATDGRHAEVQFTTDWMLDANRRDLTINSMFLGLDGSVYDYFYGYEDVIDKKIAFVGNTEDRIREDYLRILRYFRFYGRIAESCDGHDENTLRVISKNTSGLDNISGERIWSELKRILAGCFAGDLIKTMHHVGVLRHCGLPDDPDLDELGRVWDRSAHLKLHPVTLLASLLCTPEEVAHVNGKLKMSAHDRDLALFIVEHREEKPDTNPLRPYQKLVFCSKSKMSRTREWVAEVLKYQNSPLLQQFNEWDTPKFPITGHMLKEYGINSGRHMGDIMNELRRYWVELDFESDAKKLLKELPSIQNQLEEKRKKR